METACRRRWARTIIRARMRNPCCICRRCSAVYAAAPLSAWGLRFVDEFRPLSLLIPLCTIHLPVGFRRRCHPRLPRVRASPVWSMRTPFGTSRVGVHSCTCLHAPGARMLSGTPACVTYAHANSGALDVQSGDLGERAVSLAGHYGDVMGMAPIGVSASPGQRLRETLPGCQGAVHGNGRAASCSALRESVAERSWQ